MTIFYAALFVAGAFLALTTHPISFMRTGAKTLSVLLLALAAYALGGPWILVLALILSAVGDFALSREGEGVFLLGMGAFAAAHVVYIAMLWPASPVWWIAALVILLALSTEAWLAPNTGDLKWPVRGYVVVITVMAVLATGNASWLILIGALVFMLSDLILSIELFVLPEGHPARWYASKAVWITYFAAQSLLMFGFLAG